jgi:endogenous inhibitor of DNA gyrase (YacG/DUF329 family)
MGDRTTWWGPCPKCGKEIEWYDASSSLLYGANCECGWADPLHYYEISDDEIVLCTIEEARQNGGWIKCEKCGKEIMGSYKGSDCKYH